MIQMIQKTLVLLSPKPITNLCTKWMRQGRSISNHSTQMQFGGFGIEDKEVVQTSELSFAIKTLKPLVAGHTLVCPKRLVSRFKELTGEEVADVWLLAQDIGKQIKQLQQVDSVTFSVQDGKEAGQVIQHFHIHIIPRQPGDFEPNDKIYKLLDRQEIEEMHERQKHTQ
eukprot:TRINITY_DN10340_c0_g1_i1.p4 TRINITY_DN10340_c0_g1~~TRINITY_DN10340_c0_g1_i1.p4  ORF type:complete len:169 (-),score=17.25 TRINITY_DN10340_c0_g1_i1:973-1479(-)